MEGFEEIEAIALIDILRRGGVEVVTAGLESVVVVGSHDITIMADCLLEHVVGQKFDLIVLVGGAGTFRLKADAKLHGILQEHNRQKNLIGAICAAPMVLYELGILEGRVLTSYPTLKSEMAGVKYSELEVVVDGNIITSRGAGTALEFSLKLLELLAGIAIAEDVGKKIIYSG